MRPARLLSLLAVALLCGACSVVRKLPEGSYLVDRVTVETDRSAPKSERIAASEFDRYIRQTPNKRLLGTNFFVWMYNQADPAKDNGWNRFKRRIGEEPVLLDEALTERSAQNLKIYMESHGFFASRAMYHIDTVSKPHRARITYKTLQGPPYRYRSVGYEFHDKFLEPIVLQDTSASLLRAGDIYNISTLEAERERVTAYLRRRGYYDFTVNNLSYRFIIDTTGGNLEGDLRMVVRQHLKGYDERGEALMTDNTVYRIAEINILPDYDPSVEPERIRTIHTDTVGYLGLGVVYGGKRTVRPRVLRQTVPLYPNYLFDAEQVDQTYNNLMSTGYFKNAKIVFEPLPADESYVSYIGADSAALRSTREEYLRCDILATPQLRQSYKIELEGSTTSSFYGLSATVGYQNRNLFRGMESFDAAFTVGYEHMKARDALKRKANEFGVTAGLVFPRFVLPFRTNRRNGRLLNPRTRLELSYNYQDRPYYRRSLSSAAWTYSWNNTSYSAFSVRPVDINLVSMHYLNEELFFDKLQNLYLRNSFTSQLIAGISGSYTYNNQLKHPGGNATLVRFNWETAGNLIHGLEHLFSHPADGGKHYEIFGIRYSQYFRTDISASRKLALGPRTAIAGRLYLGAGMAYGNSTSIPFDRLFYSGGSNSMRGWVPRMLGPGSTPVDADRIAYPVQLGDMKLEANVELRFPVWGIFNGALFLDAGNIWFLRRSDEYDDASVFRFGDFYRQLGFNTGIGLRLDITFAVLRLDWGIQLHNPNNPEGQRWMRHFKWKNTALNFGVGYPF